MGGGAPNTSRDPAIEHRSFTCRTAPPHAALHFIPTSHTQSYSACPLPSPKALDLRWQHGPPAVAGEIFSRPVAPPSGEEEEGAGEAPGPDSVEVDGGSQAPALGTGVMSCAAVSIRTMWMAKPAGLLHALSRLAPATSTPSASPPSHPSLQAVPRQSPPWTTLREAIGACRPRHAWPCCMPWCTTPWKRMNCGEALLQATCAVLRARVCMPQRADMTGCSDLPSLVQVKCSGVVAWGASPAR